MNEHDMGEIEVKNTEFEITTMKVDNSKVKSHNTGERQGKSGI